MKNIKIVNIIGKGYNCNINFETVVECFHNTDKNIVVISFRFQDNNGSLKNFTYNNVIEVNYIGEY